MTPTIEPGDVVLIDQNLARRRHPLDGRIYAINTGPLTGKAGGALQRVDLSGRTLILSSDHLDKTAHPTRTFEIKAATLPEVLVGEVVWCGRSLGRGKRR
jgi:phage repressor protein C with HTH and peptisase S24 domain